MNTFKNYISNYYKKYQDLINYSLLIILPFLVFFNSLNSYFVVYDEFGSLLHTKRNIIDIFITNIHGTNSDTDSWRPLEVLSHIFDIIIYGDENTFGRRLTNLIIHIFNVILVYKIGLVLTKKRVIGLLAGLLFAVHFMHSYSISPITWIPGRTDLIVTFFYLFTFILFIRFLVKGSLLNYFLSFLTFTLALLTKEMAATLPGIILLYLLVFSNSKMKNNQISLKNLFRLLWVPIFFGFILLLIGFIVSPDFIAGNFSHDHSLKQFTIIRIKYLQNVLIVGGSFLITIFSIIFILIKFSSKSLKLFLHIRYIIPYFLTLFFYIVIRSIILGGTGGANFNLSYRLGIDTFLRDIYSLLALVSPLSNEYNNLIFKFQIEHNIIFYTISIIISITLLFVLIKLIISKSYMLIFTFLWVFITLIPVHNVLIAFHQFQQRYLYLPLVGFCLFLSILINSLIQNKDRTPSHIKTIVIGIIILIITVSSIFIYNRNTEINESGRIMLRFSRDLSKYRSQIFGNAKLYFITFPVDPLSTTSAVWIDEYIEEVLNYVNSKHNLNYKLSDCNILLYTIESTEKINIKWLDERNIIISRIDPSQYFLIPKEPSFIEEQRSKIYNFHSNPLLKSLSTMRETNTYSLISTDCNKVELIVDTKTDKEVNLRVELKDCLNLEYNSFFFVYEEEQFKLVHKFYR